MLKRPSGRASSIGQRTLGNQIASRTAGFIYTTLLKPRFVRALANWIILSILPRMVAVGGANIVINPRDPVVSGALALGLYEKAEIRYIQRACEPGQVVIDIGANVGLYTAIAAAAVGPSGKVIAIEPDPECVRYLEKTILANNLNNVTIVEAAASSTNGSARLFTSSQNRGDNRMYDPGTADGLVEVSSLRLDDYLEADGVTTVDVIKIDVQGFEGHVVKGLERTIRSSLRLKMLIEFWPQGLLSAGTDPFAFLEYLEALGLTLFELKGSGATVLLQDKKRLIGCLPGRKYTNLVLLAPDAALRSRT